LVNFTTFLPLPSGYMGGIVPKEQLATLLSALLLEIAVALAARKIGDDQDHG